VFCDGQVGVDERIISSSLGHPQPTTVVHCDDERAVGLAEQTVRAKKSKSIDVRFDWIQGWARQKQFKAVFVDGGLNRADFFTKALPAHVHQEMAPMHAPPPTPAALASCPVLFSWHPLSLTPAPPASFSAKVPSLPILRHLFQPKALPSLTFSLPDGGLLPVDGSKAGALQFPKKSETVDCHIVPDASLAHDLFGASPLIGHHGRAAHDAKSVIFFDTPASTAPFLSGSKAVGAALWCLQVPVQIFRAPSCAP
jgi:hypothetical protein